jgi:chemotaxis protein methyltransferase WspC
MLPGDFEGLLKNAIGLDAASLGATAVDSAVKQRMASLGLKDAGAYWAELDRSRTEHQALVEAVVVSETWFFREREAFTALGHLAADALRNAASNRTFRMLSVPCSTGEEPYSMVMTLLDAGLAPERFHVDAVDISTRALESAKAGVYVPNSFRGGSLSFRESFFQRTGDAYAISDRLRRLVTLRAGNLLSTDFNLDQEPYDVIFGRNLLSYFDRPTQERALKNLTRALAPDGYLFVASAEAYVASTCGLDSVDAVPFAFRSTAKTCIRPKRARPARGTPLDSRSTSEPRRHAQEPVFTPVLSPSSKAAPSLEMVRVLADEGRLEEAACSCERVLERQGPSSEGYYLLGLVRDALGNTNDAIASYRKAIYLKPDHAEGLLHLALLTEAQGDTAAAERLRQRARRIDRQPAEGTL